MVTYLDLLNEARGLERSSPLTATEIASTTSGEATVGVQAMNQAVRWVLKSSVNYDFFQPIIDVTLASGNNIVPPPTTETWNPQIIQEIRLVEGTDRYRKLIPVGRSNAKELEFSLTEQDRPLYFYIEEGVVKVIPTPNQAYTLKVFYNQDLLRITASNITGTVIFPADFHDALVYASHAWLRKAVGDPEWRSILEADAKQALNKSIIRNKHGLKMNGRRLFRMKSSNPDRRL